jgi:hypothetical protein
MHPLLLSLVHWGDLEDMNSPANSGCTYMSCERFGLCDRGQVTPGPREGPDPGRSSGQDKKKRLLFWEAFGGLW